MGTLYIWLWNQVITASVDYSNRFQTGCGQCVGIISESSHIYCLPIYDAQLSFCYAYRVFHTSQHVAGEKTQRLICGCPGPTVSTVHLLSPLIHI